MKRRLEEAQRLIRQAQARADRAEYNRLARALDARPNIICNWQPIEGQDTLPAYSDEAYHNQVVQVLLENQRLMSENRQLMNAGGNRRA